MYRDALVHLHNRLIVGGAKSGGMKFAKSAEPALMTLQPSVLGGPWVPVYDTAVEFDGAHFEAAMSNLIRQPNINSTVIMRADILSERNRSGAVVAVSAEELLKVPDFPLLNPDDVVLHRHLDDVRLREVPVCGDLALTPTVQVVRRIIPRNPFKDWIINQTCLILSGPPEGAVEAAPPLALPLALGDVLVVYTPHIRTEDETPFYLPPVAAVGILLRQGRLSIHYLPFGDGASLRALEPSARPVRIALRLLQTSAKHSQGAKDGYQKRVTHDVVVPKEAFQNRYLSLKKKYSLQLVERWVELTDPKKHVFEDLAIAAFLIELWARRYPSAAEQAALEFRDLGCGNGLLVYILISEGYRGQGIDARARKSWATYPPQVQRCLREQVVIPRVLLELHPAVRRHMPAHAPRDNGRLFLVPEAAPAADTVPLVGYYSLANLLVSTQVCTGEFAPTTFVIGNHLDELTCWIPLLGYPFVVIPCCLHALLGRRHRFAPRAPRADAARTSKGAAGASSTYGSLVDHVEDLARRLGWAVEREMLRIPSTRNAALIGMRRTPQLPGVDPAVRLLDIVALEGGAEGWVENAMALMKKPPRGH